MKKENVADLLSKFYSQKAFGTILSWKTVIFICS